jgi:glycosyltransferase involved in cell wall biosynthesis
VRDDAKKRLIAQSQFVLFSTQPDLWEEAFGIVQLEAMAAGKPLIASNTQVTRFLQSKGLKAALVKPDDADAWAEQAAVLLNDANRRKQLGSANVIAAAHFDWRPIATEYRDVYKTCVK